MIHIDIHWVHNIEKETFGILGNLLHVWQLQEENSKDKHPDKREILNHIE